MLSDRSKIPAFLRPWRGQKVLVGFSGGCDSTALLLLLPRWGWRGELLEAVHFDHGLRGEESRQDAVWCENFCRERGIAFRKVELHCLPCPNLEAAARAARLAYYRRIAPVAVMLAHHADDAAETLFLRLIRGSNASALAALRPVRRLGEVTFLRPLLACRRSELEDFLRAEGVADWRCDASNRDGRFARNELRNRFLPEFYRAFPAARAGVLRALKALTDDAEYLESCAEEKLREIAASQVTPLAFWRGLAPALRVRVLRRYLETRCGEGVLLNGAMADRFAREIGAFHASGVRFRLGPGMNFRIAGGKVEFFAGEEAVSPAEEVAWDWRREPEKRWKEWLLTAETGVEVPDFRGVGEMDFYFDAARLPQILYLGPRRAGETLETGDGPRRIKHLLANRPLPVAPVVLRSGAGRVLAVPGVRRSAAAPVTEQTAAAVRISARIVSPETGEAVRSRKNRH